VTRRPRSAAPGLRPREPLAALRTEPERFSFDAAVRILTFYRRRADPAEAVRFTSVAGSSFPGAEVAEARVEPGTAAPQLTVGLIGLTGPVGVLPRHYSDAVVADQRSRSFSLTRFLDLLSHRMVAAFAAAGAKYRPHRAADVGVLTPERPRADPVAEILLALTGYATPGLAERLPAGAATLRHYAGLFSAHPRSVDRLQALASDWLGRPVRVEQFVGAWIPVPPDQRTRLPVGLAPGAFGQLGVDAAAGIRAWDQQSRIVLRIGPLDLPYFQRMLPNRPRLRELVSLVRAFVGFEVSFAVNLVLHRDAVPPLILSGADDGQAGAGSAGPRLGWNTWLPMAPATPRRADAGEAIFEAEIVEGLA
jgi:type VI secretion system protein ImpH